jgi:hypothetical protein
MDKIKINSIKMQPLRNQTDLKQLDQLAWILDSSIRIPGTKLTIGLDGLIGLIPGIGDIASGLISLVTSLYKR